MAVLRDARVQSTPSRWTTPLRVAAAVVLIAGVAAGGVYVYGQLDRGDGGGDAASSADEAPEDEREAGAPGAEPDEESAEEARSRAPASYPEVRRTGREHDPDSIVALARSLRDEARTALDRGFPPDAFAFYDAQPVDSFSPAARDALVCAGQGLEPERSVVPFVIEEAGWAGEPAWVVSYLQGPEPSASYDRLQIHVVHRQECRVLHFAEQRL